MDLRTDSNSWLQADGSLRLSSFAWPTRDRPSVLRRGLEAWRSALAEGGFGTPDLLVADDSAIEVGSTLSVAQEAAASYPGKVLLLDKAFGKRLAETLGGELGGEAGEAASFALGIGRDSEAAIGRYGAARNLILLALAGRAFAMSDDDVLPEFRQSGDASEQAFESETPDPTIMAPYSDEAELESLSPRIAKFPGDLYGQLLGAGYTAESGGLARSVAALCFGSWGDSGLPASRYLLSGRAAAQEFIYEDEAAYEAAMCGRSLYRAAPAVSVGGTFFMGMHTALDARGLLPPFSPIGRGEDGLWGAMLRFLHPDLAIAYAPLAVRHAPSEARQASREAALAFSFRLNDLLLYLLLEGGIREGTQAEAYAALGSDLEELSRRPAPAFCRALAELRSRVAESRIAILDAALAAYDGEPGFWARDVREARARAALELEREDFILPDDFADGAPALQDYVGNLGRLISAWPSIFGAAARLSPELLLTARLY